MDHMLIVIGAMKIRPDKIAEWEAVFARRRVQVLRDEDYTLRYDLFQSAEDPCDYIAIEAFADAGGHERHLKASIGHEAMIACFAEKPTISKYQPVKNCT